MPLRHTLLGLLNKEPMHGYKLRQCARDLSWIYPMSNASIYPALHRLENEGFVTHSTETHAGRARKVYSVTDLGKLELESWLANPSDPKPSFRDATLLKIVMQSGRQPNGSDQDWLESALVDLRSDLNQDLAQPSDRESADGDECQKLAQIYRQKMLKLRIQFLDKVIASRLKNRTNSVFMLDRTGDLEGYPVTTDVK